MSLFFLFHAYVAEELSLYIRKRGLVIRKEVIKSGGRVVGEYLYIKHGLFEAEAEYDVEDGVLYYLQICWFKRCFIWYDGEPDAVPPMKLLKKAIAVFKELSGFSSVATVAVNTITSYLRRSSRLRSSDLAHPGSYDVGFKKI